MRLPQAMNTLSHFDEIETKYKEVDAEPDRFINRKVKMTHKIRENGRHVEKMLAFRVKVRPRETVYGVICAGISSLNIPGGI